MSLKLVRRPGTKAIFVSGSIRGVRVRESTGTDRPREAAKYREAREEELYRITRPGADQTVTFARAVNSYLDVEPRAPGTLTTLNRLLLHFGQTPIRSIGQEQVDEAIKAVCRPDAAPGTKLRQVISPLQAVLNHAARRQWCYPPAFEKPRQVKPTTTFLRPAQATALLGAAASHLRPLLVFLIGTGCRMSEALELEWEKVDLHGARAAVWQKQQNERQVDLPPVVVTAMANLDYPERNIDTGRPVINRETMKPFRVAERTGRVFRTDDGLPYANHKRTFGGQIGSAFDGACRRAGLVGVTPHMLRHTWASWHYAVHRDVLLLKVAGGWSTLTMVERYVHLMPQAYAEEARVWWAGAEAPPTAPA